MSNELQIVDERNILGKDVKIYGTIEDPLFLAKDVAVWLEERDGYTVARKVDTDEKLIHAMCVGGQIRELTFLTEDGLYEVLMQSRKDISKPFKKQIKKVLKELRTTGKVDLIEKAISNIQDEKHRQLRLEIHKFEEILEINPSDMLVGMMLNNKKNELELYLQNKKLSEVEDKIDTLSNRIESTTNLREGDMNASYIAKQLNIYSVNNRPHNLIAKILAQVLGFYVNPTGNIGYKDDYVKINLTSKGGKEVPEISYTELALNEMKDYLQNGDYVISKAIYKKGINKGDFKEGYMIIEGQKIKINETTYNLYKNY